jgi:hypothetical protein
MRGTVAAGDGIAAGNRPPSPSFDTALLMSTFFSWHAIETRDPEFSERVNDLNRYQSVDGAPVVQRRHQVGEHVGEHQVPHRHAQSHHADQ